MLSQSPSLLPVPDSASERFDKQNMFSFPALQSPLHPYQLSPSPSPLLPNEQPHSQDPFLHSDPVPYPAEDPSLDTHKPVQKCPNPNPSSTFPTQDQRRMSEPAALGAPPLYPNNDSRYQNFAFPYSRPSSSALYLSPPLHRGASTGSLRDLRHHHFEYPPHHQEWKHDDSRQREHEHDYYNNRSDVLDDPVSPIHNTFSHNIATSPTGGMPYSPISDNPYGPSPPGTGTSTSSSIAPHSAGIPCSPSRSISQHLQRSLSASQISADPMDRKTYSFVALPGNAVKKRPRRRYDEIERLYLCSWPDCNKSYGTLNHLNAHVTMQKHGPKRSPNEFKELRKQWRKAKKEQEAAAMSLHRQESFSDSYDDHSAYNHRYLSSHSSPLHHRPHHVLGLASSVPIASNDRFAAMGMDDMRYQADDGLGAYDPMSARLRYSNLQPASWHGASHLSQRNVAQNYSNVQQQQQQGQGHAHHSQLPQLAITSRVPQHQAHEADYLNSRLPQNSTLLTPLYPPSSMIPTVQNGNGSMSYPADAFELYDTDVDSNGRPGTGHASIASLGHGSGDDFDHPQ